MNDVKLKLLIDSVRREMPEYKNNPISDMSMEVKEEDIDTGLIDSVRYFTRLLLTRELSPEMKELLIDRMINDEHMITLTILILNRIKDDQERAKIKKV
jgi:hypothetical protein